MIEISFESVLSSVCDDCDISWRFIVGDCRPLVYKSLINRKFLIGLNFNQTSLNHCHFQDFVCRYFSDYLGQFHQVFADRTRTGPERRRDRRTKETKKDDLVVFWTRWKGGNYLWRHNLRSIKKIWKKIEVLIDPQTKLRLTSIILKTDL